LNKELPFDSLTPSWHSEDGTDDFTIGILARSGDGYHSIMIYTHDLDALPEPKEIYPAACLRRRYASNLFSGGVTARNCRSARNSAELDGASQWQVDPIVRLVRRILDGNASKAAGRYIRVRRGVTRAALLPENFFKNPVNAVPAFWPM